MAQERNPGAAGRAGRALLEIIVLLGRALRGQVVHWVGGPARARVVAIFGAVLALSGADASTVGAVAPQLEHAMRIGNAKIGLLSSVVLLIGALFVLPVGMYVDRHKRIPLLAISIVLWSIASLASAFADTYWHLLLTRFVLGAVTATAGPAIASLTGDYFSPEERGRVYAYILGGEAAGTAVGFIVSGSVASLISWRVAFVLLSLPGFFLARTLWRTVPEPQRGGQSRLAHGALDFMGAAPHEASGPPWPAEATTAPGAPGGAPASPPSRPPSPPSRPPSPPNRPPCPWGRRLCPASRRTPQTEPPTTETEPPTVGAEAPTAGAEPADAETTDTVGLLAAMRYILSIPTNLLLIVGSSLGYFYFAGLQTFALLFVRGHYHVSQATSELGLGLLVLGALIGTLVSGQLTDLMLHRGIPQARVILPAVCYLGSVALFIPGILGRHLFPALWFDVAGAALVSAANPPLDAARLDIMPAWLWGRAESTRTFLRSLAQALAPLAFGGLSQLIAGIVPSQAPIGTHPGLVSPNTATGLEVTFLIMLATLAAAGMALARARNTYVADVAAAGTVRPEDIDEAAPAPARPGHRRVTPRR